jgi:hypothetical protein
MLLSVFDTLNDEKFIHICNDFLDKFIVKKIKYLKYVPVNIFYGISKISFKSIAKSGVNDGFKIEEAIIDNIGQPSVVKHNIYLGTIQGGKKGEFDVVVGDFDYGKQIYRIRSIYDIKRSARLIPDDVDKFNSSLEDPIKLIGTGYGAKPSVDVVTAKKMKSFTKGYLYINDWDVRVETAYCLRDLLIDIISKNAYSKEFFINFMTMIHYETSKQLLRLTPTYYDLLRNMISKQSTELEQKLSEYDIRKCSPEFQFASL